MPALLQRIKTAWRVLRGYDGAQNSKTWAGRLFGGHRSANAELAIAGDVLRMRSLDLYRNDPTARSIVEGLVSLIVGSGIDLEPDTGDRDIDADLRQAWTAFCDEPAANGKLDFWELQRQAVRATILTGDTVWQLVALADWRRPIPTAIHAIDSSQLATSPLGTPKRFYRGIEYNDWNKPVAYHIGDVDDTLSTYAMGGLVPRSPLRAPEFNGGNDLKNIRRIPADQIIHAYEATHPGQLRGEPWLAPVLGVLQDEKDLIRAELTSAKVGAALCAFIMSAGGFDGVRTGPDDNKDDNGNPITKIEPGAIVALGPGETIAQIASNRPSQQIAPFSRLLRGGTAAAMRCRQQDLDKDYSTANYSSMRAAALDTQRLLAPVTQYLGKMLVLDLYHAILPELAVAAGHSVPANAAAKRRFYRAKIMPDGMPYVDPQKDVAAAVEAIRAGLSTWQHELSTRGKDSRQVLRQLKQELADDTLATIFMHDKKSAEPAKTEDQAPPPKETEEPDDTPRSYRFTYDKHGVIDGAVEVRS